MPSTARIAPQPHRLCLPIQARADVGPSLRRVGPEQREEVEAFIRSVYQAQFGARIRAFLPELYTLRDGHDEITAALGLRLAATAPLFLESYLPHRIEQCIAAASGRPVCRHQVVEIGNLAGRDPGVLRQILPRMGEVLRQRGLRWLCFTGHARLINSFRRLGIQLLPLGPAGIDALPEAQRPEWGSYYLHDPIVVACDISAGREQLLAHPELLSARFERALRSDA